MEKITTREKLIERLEDICVVEILARKGYVQDIGTFNNFLILDTIQKIKNDEDRHIELLNKLTEMLKSGKFK